MKLYREWKVPLSKSNYMPSATLVSFFDLMFYYDEKGAIKTRYRKNCEPESWKSKGYELEHSIIVFDESVYKFPTDINNSTDEYDGESKSRLIEKDNSETLPEGARNLTEEEKIAYNENEENEPVDFSPYTTFEYWEKVGFDISLAKYDKRTKPLFITEENAESIIGYTEPDIPNSDNSLWNTMMNLISPQKLFDEQDYYYPGDEVNGLKIFKKDGALRPIDTKDVMFYSSNFEYGGNKTVKRWLLYDTPFKVSPEDDWKIQITTAEGKVETRKFGHSDADIILCNHDISFQNRFIDKESSFKAYNGVCLNWSSKAVWKMFFVYYGANPNEVDAKFNVDVTKIFEDGFDTSSFRDLDSLSVWLEGFLVDKTEPLNLSPVLIYLMKHCYLWVKCSFFADYIDYRDFDQKLNKASDVIHSNLMLTKSGNFNKFDEAFTDTDIRSEEALVERDQLNAKNTRPYLPQTTPIIDLIKNEVLKSKDPNDTKSEIQFIIDESMKIDSEIGSLPIEPFERFYKNRHHIEDMLRTFEGRDDITIPVWFDPNQKYLPNPNIKDEQVETPILFPKEGNLITNGRIISPSIDEIWQIIKKIIAGRKIDDDKMPVGLMGYPRAESDNFKISTDTTLKLKEYNFKSNPKEIIEKGETKISDLYYNGDPLSISYDFKDEEDLTVEILARANVTSWVNDPEVIEYSNLDVLINVNNKLNPGLSDRSDTELRNAISGGIDDDSEFNDIYNAQKDKPLKDIDYSITSILGNIEHLDHYYNEENKYTPEENPLSLRELEAQVLGLKRHFAAYTDWISNLTAYNAEIPRYNKDTNPSYNFYAGQLFQLHKDYRSNTLNNPNTVYDERFNRLSKEELQNNGIGLGEIKEPIWNIPTSDRDSRIKQIIPSNTVYLAADGEYHSTKQLLLIPIFNDGPY